jgi:hypothetical protein
MSSRQRSSRTLASPTLGGAGIAVGVAGLAVGALGMSRARRKTSDSSSTPSD